MPTQVRGARVAAATLASLAIAAAAAAQDQSWTPNLGPSLGVIFGAVPTADAGDVGRW